jgi:hypothetical protein
MNHREFVNRLNSGVEVVDTRVPLSTVMESVDRYADLRRILADAYRFAAVGKGEERHGKGGLPWTQQRHVTIGRELGTGFALGQAAKKIFEGRGLPTKERKIAELLGAMTYLASAIYLIEQGVD